MFESIFAGVGLAIVVAGIVFCRVQVPRIMERNRQAPRLARRARLRPHRKEIKLWVHEALQIVHRKPELPHISQPPTEGPLHLRGGFDPEELYWRGQRECRAILEAGYPERPWHEHRLLYLFGGAAEFIQGELADELPQFSKRSTRQIMDLLDAYWHYERRLWTHANTLYRALAKCDALHELDALAQPQPLRRELAETMDRIVATLNQHEAAQRQLEEVTA